MPIYTKANDSTVFVNHHSMLYLLLDFVRFRLYHSDMVYSSEDTLFMLASEKVTGDPFYTGDVVYTFTDGRLRNSRPVSMVEVKSISELFKDYPLPTGTVHLVVGMHGGNTHRKEMKTN